MIINDKGNDSCLIIILYISGIQDGCLFCYEVPNEWEKALHKCFALLLPTWPRDLPGVTFPQGLGLESHTLHLKNFISYFQSHNKRPFLMTTTVN